MDSLGCNPGTLQVIRNEVSPACAASENQHLDHCRVFQKVSQQLALICGLNEVDPLLNDFHGGGYRGCRQMGQLFGYVPDQLLVVS
jgi:hypothetical protein